MGQGESNDNITNHPGRIDSGSKHPTRHRRETWTVRIALFGSLARGDAGADSDVDFLVQMEPGRSFVDVAGLKWDLEAL